MAILAILAILVTGWGAHGPGMQSGTTVAPWKRSTGAS